MLEFILIYLLIFVATLVYSLADKYVETNTKLIITFVLLSLVWPILWALYFLDTKK